MQITVPINNDANFDEVHNMQWSTTWKTLHRTSCIRCISSEVIIDPIASLCRFVANWIWCPSDYMSKRSGNVVRQIVLWALRDTYSGVPRKWRSWFALPLYAKSRHVALQLLWVATTIWLIRNESEIYDDVHGEFIFLIRIQFFFGHFVIAAFR